MPPSRAQLFLWLYVCAIVYLSFYPGTFLPYPRRSLSWLPLVGRRMWLDAALNLLFYVPLGVAAVAASRQPWRGWWFALLGGGGLSLLIEYLQRWSASRYPSWNDWATNTAGAALGATLAWSLGHRLPWGSARISLRPSVLMWMTAWALWQAFPFIPRISLAGVRAQFAGPLWSWRAWVEAALGFAILRTALGPSRWLWPALALLPAQAVLVSQDFSPAAILGAGLGWLAAARAERAPRWTLAALVLAWLIWEQFRPFQWNWGEAPRPFLWSPFESWWQAGEQVYGPLFRKFFFYCGAVWAWRRAGGQWPLAAGVPAVLVAVGEAFQRYQPSRTPESTDVVLLAAGAWLLHWTAQAESRKN